MGFDAMKVATEPKKSGGWKSKLGAFLKAIGGIALGYFVEQVLPGLVGHPTTGAGVAVATMLAGDALNKYGMAAKAEKQLEATEAAAK